MKKKATNTITELEELTKDCSYLDALYSEAFCLFPEKESWRKRLIYSMKRWASHERSLHFQKFLDKYNIPQRTWIAWIEKFDDIGEAYKDVKCTIAANRQQGSMEKYLDWTPCKEDIHTLSPTWEADVDDYKVRKKKQAEDSNISVDVYMENYGDKE